MTRQEYNKQILDHLISSDFFRNFFNENMCRDIQNTLIDCITNFPDQRFGQIFCNYIYPDYRSRTEPSFNMVMDMLFYNIDMDPFYEESQQTFNRLCYI